MTDQEILAGPKETLEDSGTLGLNIYGNVGGNMQTVLSYTATGQVPGARTAVVSSSTLAIYRYGVSAAAAVLEAR